jgi:hypothetical protein
MLIEREKEKREFFKQTVKDEYRDDIKLFA